MPEMARVAAIALEGEPRRAQAARVSAEGSAEPVRSPK
jgi:hypothetical protein